VGVNLRLIDGIRSSENCIYVVHGVWSNCSRVTRSQFSLFITQISVDLNIEVDPIVVSLSLYATVLPNTHLRATEGMLDIDQRRFDF
jgi:hypothetical protein